MEPWLSDLLIYSNYCLSFVFAIEMVVKLVGLGIRGYSYGLYSYGLYSHGLDSYGLYSYGHRDGRQARRSRHPRVRHWRLRFRHYRLRFQH